MKKYTPIVTDHPTNTVSTALNLAFQKNREVYIRGYGPAPEFKDAKLCDVLRDILAKHCPDVAKDERLKDDFELAFATAEWLMDGTDTLEGVVALLYDMAWALAEMRERLKMYEESCISPIELHDHLLSPFQNDMFSMVWCAFKNLYPDKECEIFWEPNIRDDENGHPAYGLTDFADDGSVTVFVKPDLAVVDAVEVLAHELAHVAVGIEHDHDEVWEAAFENIFQEYNRIGDSLFPACDQCELGEQNAQGS